MKVVFKPQQKIEMFEAIEIKRDLIGQTLFESETIKQEIVEREDGKLVLRANEIEKNVTYESVQDIDIFVEVGDYLIKMPKGYMKPIQKAYKVDKALKDAITKVNEI